MEVQQKNLCFMAFVLFCMISKHLLHVAGRENKSSCQCWSKAPHLLVELSFPDETRDLLFTSKGWVLVFVLLGPSLVVVLVLCKSPLWGPAAGNSHLKGWSCGTVALSHGTPWPLELWQQLWEGCVGLSICFQEPLKLWLPQLTLQVLLWKNRCFSLH